MVGRRYGTFGLKFVTPKDLENMRLNSLTSLAANTRLITAP